jgi:signal transduction histidine kinase
LSNEQRRNILLVTKEIINNAVKYSKARNISVKASLNESKLDFEVADDGAGFDITIKHPGNGLKNIRHRIEELRGVLGVESAPGKGSRFVYSIPLRSTT